MIQFLSKYYKKRSNLKVKRKSKTLFSLIHLNGCLAQFWQWYHRCRLCTHINNWRLTLNSQSLKNISTESKTDVKLIKYLKTPAIFNTFFSMKLKISRIINISRVKSKTPCLSYKALQWEPKPLLAQAERNQINTWLLFLQEWWVTPSKVWKTACCTLSDGIY